MSGVAVLVGDGNGNGGQGEGGIRGLTAIPSNMKKTIQNIREITGKQHSDDDIYAVLKECSMDPNETAQKLLYLGMYPYKFTIFLGFSVYVCLHQGFCGSGCLLFWCIRVLCLCFFVVGVGFFFGFMGFWVGGFFWVLCFIVKVVCLVEEKKRGKLDLFFGEHS